MPAQVQPRVQERRTAQSVRRAVRAHDPIQGRGKTQGRARGSPNYRPREVEILLDLVEDELPVGSKGWSTIGARFREWAATTEHPSRTDRSLEIKYKQVCSIGLLHAGDSDDNFHSLYGLESQPGMANAHLRLSVHMKSTTRSRRRFPAVILRTMRSPNSRKTTMCPMTLMATRLLLPPTS